MRLQKAILEFIGNELQLDPHSLTSDTIFADLGLAPMQTSDLLHHLQDALGITLSIESVEPVITIGDIFTQLENDSEEETS